MSASAASPARPDVPVERYETLVRAWLATSDETILQEAYELGRWLLASDFGVLDLVTLHDRVVAPMIDERPQEAADLVAAARAVLVESLSPFEMTHRGFWAAHEALRGSEERYRDLVENANDMIFTTDLDGRLTSLNRAGELLTGYSRDEVLPLTIDSLLAPESLRVVHMIRPMALGHQGGRTRYELEMVARDGQRIPLEVSMRLIYSGDQATGLHGIARDVTDRKRAEYALRHLNQRLEDKVKSIAHALHDEAGQLLASVYLNVAEIASELPHRGRQRLGELRALLDQVDEQLRRLAHELRPTILDDLGLVPACEFLAEGVSRRAQLRVTVRGATGGRLPADVETALYRVAQEALSNATRHGHPKNISVEFERVDGVVKGAIRDDGTGFDVPAVLAHSNRQGLGLMGMRERVVAVGGKLTISSSPDSGTSVAFEVPVE
jgi:PAS domain S-box-containing protein